MELICPSCDARYELPDGSVGENGRQVSCMNCGHVWQAFPPLMLGASERKPPKPDSAGIPFGSTPGSPAKAANYAEQALAAQSHMPGVEDEVATAGGIPDRVSDTRSEQLAEIREMLAEVQSEVKGGGQPREDGAPAEEMAAASLLSGNVAPAPSAKGKGRSRGIMAADLDDEPQDSFQARRQSYVDSTEPAKPVDLKKMQRKHERKERAREREKKRQGSSAFTTGFLLVAMIAAIMISLYILHPAIIERMPGTEAALTEYVATIDGLRVGVAEQFEEAKSWVIERADKSGS